MDNWTTWIYPQDCIFKGISHPKIIIISSFTQSLNRHLIFHYIELKGDWSFIKKDSYAVEQMMTSYLFWVSYPIKYSGKTNIIRHTNKDIQIYNKQRKPFCFYEVKLPEFQSLHSNGRSMSTFRAVPRWNRNDHLSAFRCSILCALFVLDKHRKTERIKEDLFNEICSTSVGL